MIQEIHFKNKDIFRKWLDKNHDKSGGIWMLYFKKHTKKPSVDYSDALDEALCYGWIDSIVKRVDDEQYVRKFTPRKNIKNWSEVNKVKVMRLIQQERMTLFGLQKIESYKKTGKIKWDDNKVEIDYGNIKNTPKFLTDYLKMTPSAYPLFQKLAPSYRKEYTRWVLSAKRDETRSKRLNSLIEKILSNCKPGIL